MVFFYPKRDIKTIHAYIDGFFLYAVQKSKKFDFSNARSVNIVLPTRYVFRPFPLDQGRTIFGVNTRRGLVCRTQQSFLIFKSSFKFSSKGVTIVKLLIVNDMCGANLVCGDVRLLDR